MDETPISNPFDENENHGQQVVWVVLGLTAACFGLLLAGAVFWFRTDIQSLAGEYFPSPTPTPSRTPIPTATNTPTPTPNMTATAQILNAQATAESVLGSWNVVHLDPFDTNEYNWLVETSEDEYASTTYEIVDGKYRWDTTAHKSLISWVQAERTSLSDFYLSVEIQQIEGPDTADYGVIFREDDDSNFYYFGVNDRGYYVLYMFHKEWSTLVDWTETDIVQQGEVNRVTVIGEDSHFTFFINDQYLMEYYDATIPEGSTSLAIELANTDDHAIFEFDNFELRAP